MPMAELEAEATARGSSPPRSARADGGRSARPCRAVGEREMIDIGERFLDHRTFMFIYIIEQIMSDCRRPTTFLPPKMPCNASVGMADGRAFGTPGTLVPPARPTENRHSPSPTPPRPIPGRSETADNPPPAPTIASRIRRWRIRPRPTRAATPRRPRRRRRIPPPSRRSRPPRRREATTTTTTRQAARSDDRAQRREQHRDEQNERPPPDVDVRLVYPHVIDVEGRSRHLPRRSSLPPPARAADAAAAAIVDIAVPRRAMSFFLRRILQNVG